MKNALIKIYIFALPAAALILAVAQFYFKFSPAIITIPIILFVLEFSYRHFSPIYFFVNKCIGWVLNRSTRWNFSVEYSKIEDPEEAVEIVSRVISEFGDASVWANKETSKIFQLKGFNCEVNIHQDVSAEYGIGEKYLLNIRITHLEVPYRSAERILHQEVVPLLDKIQETLNPPKKKFVFTCEMQSMNPYYGLLLRKIDIPNIERFNVEFTEKVKGSEKSRVTINKTKVTVVSDNLIAFQNLSRKYLALSPKI